MYKENIFEESWWKFNLEELDTLQFSEHDANTHETISLETLSNNKELLTNLNELLKDIKFDQKLYKTYTAMLNQYITKNQDHIEFYGGKLLGVHIVRFTNDDYENFFAPLGITPKEVTEKLKDFYTVKQNFSLFGDPYYLLGYYMIHKFLTSKDLDKKMHEPAAKVIAMFMNIRIFTSMYTYRFRYPVNRDLAQAVYEGLSGKFMIKKVDSWYDLFMYRTSDLVDNEGLHFKVMNKFDNDKDIINAINDTRNRLSSLITNIYSLTMNYHSKGTKISTTSLTVTDLDGNDKIKDKFNNYLNDITMVKRSLTNEETFVSNNLVDIIIGITKNTNRDYLINTLRWLSDNYLKEHKIVDGFITESLTSIYDYLNDNNSVNKSVIDLLYLTKNYVISSRSEEGISEAKNKADEIIKKAIKKSSSSIIIPLRIALILYIFIKAQALRKSS